MGGAGADAAPSASRSSLLNDLIQAAGIIPDVGGGTGVVPDRSALPDGAPVDGHGRAALGSEVAAADMTPTTPDVEKGSLADVGRFFLLLMLGSLAAC